MNISRKNTVTTMKLAKICVSQCRSGCTLKFISLVVFFLVHIRFERQANL